MTEDIRKPLVDRFKQLPVPLQEAITSADLPHLIHDITLKNSLHIDQAGALETEITMVLLGAENYNTFNKNLERELIVSPLIANKIASEVNETIFKTVRQYLVDSTAETMTTLDKVEANGGEPLILNRDIIAPPINLPSAPEVTISNEQADKNILTASSKSTVTMSPNFVEDKLKNISVSSPEKISLIPTSDKKPKITNPYLEPLD